jgi:hypothetical protein
MVKKKLFLGILAAATLVGIVVAAIVYNFGFRQRFEVVSAGKIKVFLGEGETQELQQGNMITWDTITSTDMQQKTIWVKNVGTADVTLEFGHDYQQMPNDWSLNWNYTGATVAQGTTIAINMTLTLPSNINEGTYECNSGITATPVP